MSKHTSLLNQTLLNFQYSLQSHSLRYFNLNQNSSGQDGRVGGSCTHLLPLNHRASNLLCVEPSEDYQNRSPLTKDISTHTENGKMVKTKQNKTGLPDTYKWQLRNLEEYLEEYLSSRCLPLKARSLSCTLASPAQSTNAWGRNPYNRRLRKSEISSIQMRRKAAGNPGIVLKGQETNACRYLPRARDDGLWEPETYRKKVSGVALGQGLMEQSPISLC